MLSDPPEVHETLWKGISGKYGWDIGAGIGNTLSELVARFDKCVAFEPYKPRYARIMNFGDISKVRTLPLAISNINGKVDLPEIGRVNCRTVDSLMKKLGSPDFIKVDVFGHEYQVLDGARFLMTVAPPHWLIEIYSQESGMKCFELLRQYGYGFDIIRNPTLEENSPEWLDKYWVRAYVVRFNR